jgi:hypothetical protein
MQRGQPITRLSIKFRHCAWWAKTLLLRQSRLLTHIIAALRLQHLLVVCNLHSRLCLEYTALNVLRVGDSTACAVPCRAVPCRAVPCRAVPCRAVPCRTVPCRAVPCRAHRTFISSSMQQCSRIRQGLACAMTTEKMVMVQMHVSVSLRLHHGQWSTRERITRHGLMVAQVVN